MSLVTNKKPTQVFITKVKHFEFTPKFEKRSRWGLDQLRRVDGIDPDKVETFLLFTEELCSLLTD